MPESQHQHSWFGPDALEPLPAPPQDTQEFARLWQTFMNARLVLGLILLVLQLGLYLSGSSHSILLTGICVVYFLGTGANRLMLRPSYLGQVFNRTWGALVGLDVGVFAALQWLQGGTLNYTSLFALPVLLAAVLGPLRLALGTVAGISLLLLGGVYWVHRYTPVDATPAYVQAGLASAGYFLVAFLAHQLASRLASEGLRARRSQLAANIQRQVNELVIESLPNGVMIVDVHGMVRAANPSARHLLASGQFPLHTVPFDLKASPAWQPLLKLTRITIGTGGAQRVEVTIQHPGNGPRRVQARTSLAAPLGLAQDSLCVLFLQDQREQEARLRTEKMASMGRLSTAVAHEIRNPLAAIVQANALLDEDLSAPDHRKLTRMVAQNAKRLEKIVDDILNVSRVRGNDPGLLEHHIPLHETVHRIASDWAQQAGQQAQLHIQVATDSLLVRFDPDHLRRVLINLLDNAKRYASQGPGSIQVRSQHRERTARVIVWSDGAPMDASVQRHLFEPFFSSESRSSGLGLYICRELCERHGANLAYHRSPQDTHGNEVQGNAFTIKVPLTESDIPSGTSEVPWQTSLY